MAREHEDQLLIGLPLLAFALLAVFSDATGLDRRLSDAWYDPARGFFLKHSWWAEGLIHDAGRTLVALAGIAALLVWFLSFRKPRLRFWRRPALYLFAAIALSTGTVALLKALSGRPCPWDLGRYGGGGSAGGCFPSAHGATGYSLMALFFALRDRGPRLARAGFFLGLGLGTLFGFGQVVRGAHFLSHNLWSAAVCWAVAAALYEGPFRAEV
jgi:membrane-associated PAP2 superfamily phosphatase